MSVHPDDAFCVHDLDPRTCSICRHPYRPPEPDRVERTMAARYEGTCPSCHDPIEEGDVIAHLTPSDIWVCAGCAS